MSDDEYDACIGTNHVNNHIITIWSREDGNRLIGLASTWSQNKLSFINILYFIWEGKH